MGVQLWKPREAGGDTADSRGSWSPALEQRGGLEVDMAIRHMRAKGGVLPTPVTTACKRTQEKPEVITRPGPENSRIQLEVWVSVCIPGQGDLGYAAVTSG